MKRDQNLVCLSREHHDGLVMALRISREVPEADLATLDSLYGDLLEFWQSGLLRHFRAENECLLARLIRHTPIEDKLVTRTHNDHLKMEALMADMRDDPGTRRVSLELFGEVLRQHIRWEEETLFSAVEQRFRKDEMSALGGELSERLTPQCFPRLFGDKRAGEVSGS